MSIRELQKLAHELRPYTDRICHFAYLTEVKFRAAPEGLIVIAGWGDGQLQIVLRPGDFSGRPCDDSGMIGKRLLDERLKGVNDHAGGVSDQPDGDDGNGSDSHGT